MPLEDKTPNTVLCDITGTLMRDDKPYWPVVKLVQAMHKAGHDIVFLTGLRNRHRAKVVAQLDSVGLAPSENIFLLMRPENYTHAPLFFKEEILRQHIDPQTVLLALDDTPSILRMYAKYGVPTLEVRRH
jgi:hydroxymethylpyrimidine pyrophosphatase-like HAD family hydrolase